VCARVQSELQVLTSFITALVPLHEEAMVVSDVKVIASIDDVPGRCFAVWSSANVGQHSSGTVNAELAHMPIPQKISGAYLGMLKIGRVLSAAKKSEREPILSNLRTRLGQSLPTQEVVSDLAEAEDAPTVSEFAEIYTKPIDLTLDREIVWPLERELIY